MHIKIWEFYPRARWKPSLIEGHDSAILLLLRMAWPWFQGCRRINPKPWIITHWKISISMYRCVKTPGTNQWLICLSSHGYVDISWCLTLDDPSSFMKQVTRQFQAIITFSKNGGYYDCSRASKESGLQLLKPSSTEMKRKVSFFFKKIFYWLFENFLTMHVPHSSSPPITPSPS